MKITWAGISASNKALPDKNPGYLISRMHWTATSNIKYNICCKKKQQRNHRHLRAMAYIIRKPVTSPARLL
jgi:hypothetical protein